VSDRSGTGRCASRYIAVTPTQHFPGLGHGRVWQPELPRDLHPNQEAGWFAIEGAWLRCQRGINAGGKVERVSAGSIASPLTVPFLLAAIVHLALVRGCLPLTVPLSIHPSIHPSVSIPMHPSILISIQVSLHESIHPDIYPINVSASCVQDIYPPIHLTDSDFAVITQVLPSLHSTLPPSCTLEAALLALFVIACLRFPL
jgi:hypothetical protein